MGADGLFSEKAVRGTLFLTGVENTGLFTRAVLIDIFRKHKTSV
jgi:hypothetical protein